MKTGFAASKDRRVAQPGMRPAAVRQARRVGSGLDAASLGDSPHLTTQSRNLNNAFGQALQKQAAPKAEPAQMQGAEEEEAAQMQAAEEEEPAQMQAADEEEPAQMQAAEEEEPAQMQAAEEEKPVQGQVGDRNGGLRTHPAPMPGTDSLPVVQRVGEGGEFHEDISDEDGYITVSVDRKNLGHTYIIGETSDGTWMYHFAASTSGEPLRSPTKLIAWVGSFEEIKKVEGKGRTPQEFVAGRKKGMLHAELKLKKDKVEEIEALCKNEVGKGVFSLVGSNLRFGDNCVSKVYNILAEAGVTFSWSTYLLSFLSPRLAIGYGSGLQQGTPLLHHVTAPLRWARRGLGRLLG